MAEYLYAALFVLVLVALSVGALVWLDVGAVEYEARCEQMGGSIGLAYGVPACVDREGMVLE